MCVNRKCQGCARGLAYKVLENLVASGGEGMADVPWDLTFPPSMSRKATGRKDLPPQFPPALHTVVGGSSRTKSDGETNSGLRGPQERMLKEGWGVAAGSLAALSPLLLLPCPPPGVDVAGIISGSLSSAPPADTSLPYTHQISAA